MSTMFVKFDKKEKKSRKTAASAHPDFKNRSRSSSLASVDILTKYAKRRCIKLRFECCGKRRKRCMHQTFQLIRSHNFRYLTLTESGIILRGKFLTDVSKAEAFNFYNHSRASLAQIHSSDFNLRSYLEVNGFNLDACKAYVRVEESIIRGYLQKLSHRWKVWNRRWFVLDWRAGTLIYFKTNKEHGAAQVIAFRHIMGVSTDKSSKSEPKFCLKTTQKSYVLMAPTSEVLRIWLDFLTLVIENKDK